MRYQAALGPDALDYPIAGLPADSATPTDRRPNGEPDGREGRMDPRRRYRDDAKNVCRDVLRAVRRHVDPGAAGRRPGGSADGAWTGEFVPPNPGRGIAVTMQLKF